MCFAPHAVHVFNAQRPKVVRLWIFFHLFTSRCALRHNTLHILNMWASKTALWMVCLCQFDFKMWFAPQCGAIFPHSSSKVLRSERVFDILTSTWASRRNNVQFFISHPARWVCTRHLSEPTCRLPETTNHWINKVFPDFAPFRAPAPSFFWLLLLSDCSHPCFSIHTVGSLTSKLPSVRDIIVSHLFCASSLWCSNGVRNLFNRTMAAAGDMLYQSPGYREWIGWLDTLGVLFLQPGSRASWFVRG